MNPIDDYARSVGWTSEAERRAAIDRETRQRAEGRVKAKAAQEELARLRDTGRTKPRHAATELGVTARETTT